VQPALLAWHCAEAGLSEKAVVYWLKAGQQSMDRSAMTEAVAQLRKGLEVLAGLTDGLWRRQQELDLQIALGVALSATVGWVAAEAEQALVRARMLAELLDRPEYLVPLIAGQWVFHLVRSEHRQALPLAEQLEQIGEARNEAAVKLVGGHTLGAIGVSLGDFVAAGAVLNRCIGLADPERFTIKVMGVASHPTILAWLALTLGCLGYIDQARSRIDEALSEAHCLGHTHTLALVLHSQDTFDCVTRVPRCILRNTWL
jgi:hypothetical protein